MRRQAPRGEPHRRGRQPGGPVLRRDQVRLGDGDLVGLGVAGQVDDLQPILQRQRDPRRLVRRCDEQHRGQVERQLDEHVAKSVALLGVDHLEQHGGRRGAELVDLVEHEHRVIASHAPHLAQDRAGLRVSPGAVVAAQVRLVVQPAAGQLDETPPQRVGRALRQRGLAHPGRTDETDHAAGTTTSCGRGNSNIRRILELANRGTSKRRFSRYCSAMCSVSCSV